MDITEDEIKMRVIEAFPNLPMLLETITASVYHTLYFDLCCGRFYSQETGPAAPRLLRQAHAKLNEVQELNRAADIVEALYHDAWLCSHFSNAPEETAGLPKPGNWKR